MRGTDIARKKGEERDVPTPARLRLAEPAGSLTVQRLLIRMVRLATRPNGKRTLGIRTPVGPAAHVLSGCHRPASVKPHARGHSCRDVLLAVGVPVHAAVACGAYISRVPAATDREYSAGILAAAAGCC